MAQLAPEIEVVQGPASTSKSRRTFDWRHTPLGPTSKWPPALRIMAEVLLNTPIPMCLAWGDSLTTLYNDAYRPLRGTAPDALGQPFSEFWADAWSRVEPHVARALAGEASRLEDVPIRLERSGRRVRSRWMFSYSPVADETGRIRGVLCVGQESVRKTVARTPLPPERERLARLFDQAPGFIAYLDGPDHVYQLVNQPDGRSDLLPGRELLGKSVREAFPELEGQGVVEMLDEVYRSGEPHVASGRRLVLNDADGPQEIYVDQVYQPVRADDGAITGIFVVGHDVTERMKASAAVRQREERLRLAVDAGRMAVWDIDFVAGSVAASPELNRMFGLPLDARPSLDDVLARYAPGERKRLQTISRRAQQRGDRFFEAEYRHVRADDGELRWFLIRAMVDYSEDGAALRSFGVLMDVTERKEAEERLKLLALEVDHRANNLLATVQSVVSLTRAEDLPRFRESVLGRINALAQAHRLLAESRWTAARLARVAEEELRPFMAESRVHVAGPDANLAPAVAQGLAIALHELATNAVKHGGLSRPEGRIELAWGPPDESGLVRLVWLERGGPPAAPPARAGFGMSLLRRALTGAIGGGVELDWQADGLCCTLHVPVL